MKPSKSLTSIVSQQNQLNGCNLNHRKQPQLPLEPKNDHLHQNQIRQQQYQQTNSSAPTSPICRCRVMYLGSSVPHITKDGLQGIQEPLRELYPDKANLGSGNAGIDSWLSVWSNGILIENVDETGREVKRFFKIEALHYCAAVKYVPQILTTTPNMNGNATLPHNLAALPKFLPLDSPHARMQQDSSSNPPIFASILRRTTGVKVLECHAFICKREAAANALVRCCFHAYADTMYAKQIGAEVDPVKQQHRVETNNRQNGNQIVNSKQPGTISASRRSKSIAVLNDATDRGNDSDSQQGRSHDYIESLNHQAMPRRKSISNGQQTNYYANEGDISDGGASQRIQGYESNNLQQQTKRFSKSMHQLNQPHDTFDGFIRDHQGGQPAEPIFSHNPYASRVPSYPPQNIIDQQEQQQQQLQSINGGTLRSVRSMAANSIASTLLRSKKHAKAMSMAQLNQQNVMMTNQPMSFHQLQHQQHVNGSFMTMPPVPPMFMPRANMNGSQTMKLPSRHMLQAMAPMPMNFEAMTPKEMKKLLKKSAKYGIKPGKFSENGLPALPLRPIQMQPGMFGPPPPPPPPLGADSGTFNSQSMFVNDPAHHHPATMGDMGDFTGPPNMQQQPYYMGPRGPMFPHEHNQMMNDPSSGPPQPIKSILVKPNPEFLKSKAGKKWLKQQKEFKKLLPSHLDGLPIVFGPPPLDALESAGLPNSSANGGPPPPPPPMVHPFMHTPSHLPPPPPPMSSSGMPMLDSNGFYCPHPLYGPSGRASAASTLLRNSPQVMQQHLLDEQVEYLQRNHHHQQSMYSNPMAMMGTNGSIQGPLPPPPPPMLPPHQQLSGDDLYGLHQHSGSQYNRQYQSVESTRRRRRNHMVEQSVISLGDEDNEDGEQGDEEAEDEHGRAFVKHNQRPQNNGYYNRIDGESATIDRRDHLSSRKESANGYEHPNNYQDDYEQITQQHHHQPPPNEDCNSNSSGIYRRRGHINERAFSYSIRQEASKSSADNSDAEYRNGDVSESSNYNNQSTHNSNNNNHIEYRLGNQSSHHNAAHYDSPQQGNFYQNRQPVQYFKKHPSHNHHQQQQQQPVDELSARLESQLNMKSFAN